jgi:hypothetical protein
VRRQWGRHGQRRTRFVSGGQSPLAYRPSRCLYVATKQNPHHCRLALEHGLVVVSLAIRCNTDQLAAWEEVGLVPMTSIAPLKAASWYIDSLWVNRPHSRHLRGTILWRNRAPSDRSTSLHEGEAFQSSSMVLNFLVKLLDRHVGNGQGIFGRRIP